MLVKFPVPVPSAVLLFAIVGFVVNPQQTPFAVTEAPPSLIDFPPDIAEVIIRYIPKGKIVELKSLKYYFISYRNVGIYQEAVTDRIYKDIKKLLAPQYLCIETIYNTRGGIDAKCIMETGKK